MALVTWPVLALSRDGNASAAQGLGLGFVVGGMFIGLCYELRDWMRRPAEKPE
ncbi:MAG: hypothetical protein H7X74_07540 [Methyloceanibacter sp.]|nr:hypothetical protein [Methyloceanibacter sp.]